MKRPLTAAELIAKEQRKAKAVQNKQREIDAKQLLSSQLARLGITEPQWEYQFHNTRNWRFDGAIIAGAVAIEIEGRGRHQQMHKNKKADGSKEAQTPFEKDCEKYNEAAILGWRVLRFTYAMIRDGRAADTIRRALA